MSDAHVRGRLDELGARYDVPSAGIDALARILELIAEDDTAPTTVLDPARGVDVHVADSLAGLELPAVRAATTIADLGAGAGFPGLALAAALPGARVFLVESVGRKCAFMERAIAAAGLPNASVVCARAEEWDGLTDVVTARALAPLAVIAEYAAPLLRVGGSLVAWKGARDAEEEADGAVAAAELGLDVAEVRRVTPFAGIAERHLYLYSKVSDTPYRFPRRPGMARKRPLGR
ncbi:MAG TPA: 16S rRNA (guanine(527)-N(7))-methyltransferase RsmG [Solirubrobacteraceae bacterium]